MLVKSLLAAGALLASAAPAFAGDLVVTVTTKDGAPLADAVVTLPAPSGALAPKFPWKLEIAQKDKQFAPFVLIAPVGAEVAFPNLDKFRHHVYSFSKGNKFELELYGRDQKRSVTFKAAGVAALGCNIHDNMVAFVYVADTPWAAKTNARGVAEVKGAPDGAAQVTVWHPYAKTRDQIVTTDATIAGLTRLTVVVDAAATHGH
ncbi:MAG TPA: methylamine utilization protein [Hyphomonadaceae bacterium]|nr:methylamine utilization protein [Hyphomonadaceae bacterium]